MNFYAFNIGDYAASTQHLTNDEDLAYRRLMDLYYSSESPIPTDRRQVYRLIRASTEELRAAIDTILAEFFVETPQGWTHHKCEEVISEAHERSEKAREKGKKSGAARRKTASAEPPSEPERTAVEPQLNRSLPKTNSSSQNQPSSSTPNPNPNPNPIIPNPSPDAFDKFDAALRRIPGIDKHPVFAAPVIAPIWQMAQQGYDLKQHIIPSISRQLTNRGAKRPITGWSYFVNGIIDDNSKTVAVTPPIDDEKWKSRLSAARRRKQWDVKWGPKPKQAGCMAPSNLLEPTDGDDWASWEQGMEQAA